MKSYESFSFDGYDFDKAQSKITLHYSYDNELHFSEVLEWDTPFSQTPDPQLLDQALQLLHLVIGISYVKAYLAPKLSHSYHLTADQSSFLNTLYRNGLGEFLYRNNLDFSILPTFEANIAEHSEPRPISGSGVVVPMSGGKDSLLTASMLREADVAFTPLYVTTDGHFPSVINHFGEPLIVKRTIDKQLFAENQAGAYNGHVPFSAIIGVILVVTSVLYGLKDIVLSHESSADQSTTTYKGLAINHQYSKSSAFEQAMGDYIQQTIAPNINYFSLLRCLSERDIHRLFVESGLFDKYKGEWSSCNQANYKQGNDTSELKWCGKCSKCVNSFILFAPYLPKQKLLNMFSEKNLALDKTLLPTFKDLLGLTDVRPFECVAEINEVRSSVRDASATDEWPELAQFAHDDIKATSASKSKFLGPKNYEKLFTDYSNKETGIRFN